MHKQTEALPYGFTWRKERRKEWLKEWARVCVCEALKDPRKDRTELNEHLETVEAT
jgi:hypothetical protein